jgi:hypothetical protein
MTAMINTYRASVQHPEVRDQLEDLGVDETIILEWILKNSIGRAWSGQTWLRIRTCGGSCKSGNETSGVYKLRGASRKAEELSVSQE